MYLMNQKEDHLVHVWSDPDCQLLVKWLGFCPDPFLISVTKFGNS